MEDDGKRNMMIGGIVCLIGVAVTLGTYSSAAPGGSYLIAWGAILYGGIQFIRGLFEEYF